MRIFRTKWLARYARRARIDDRSLIEAIERAEHGSIDADLGSGLIKQRVARRGQGRSGGYRMLVAYKSRALAVYLYAFAKSERENIDADELASFRAIGAAWLGADAAQLERAIESGTLQEVLSDKGAAQSPCRGVAGDGR